jgi:hypothetical protein
LILGEDAILYDRESALQRSQSWINGKPGGHFLAFCPGYYLITITDLNTLLSYHLQNPIAVL